jgi:hypothetical protein
MHKKINVDGFERVWENQEAKMSKSDGEKKGTVATFRENLNIISMTREIKSTLPPNGSIADVMACSFTARIYFLLTSVPEAVRKTRQDLATANGPK